ncbi:MAG TPA: TonB-dependent receptor [Gammaproteobacteria bacterium]|nr:TonB-dependent receptor [Gammaproteobacteria bacterium]
MRPIVILSSLLIFCSVAQAQSDEFSTIFDVSIATGADVPISRAPAIASVITAEDIQAMGARDVDDVLSTVPGLHVSRSSTAYKPLYLIRGIDSSKNGQVLVLLDGTPQTNLFLGDRGDAWGGMPVESIARIEIIRGPGSALYGADAYAGVINIITKKPDEKMDSRVGIRDGSFNTTDAWVEIPGSFLGWVSYFSLQYQDTDGMDSTIDADTQSGLDTLLGTSASLAPGPISVSNESLDARFNLKKDNWNVRLLYQTRDLGVGTGVADALDPQGRTKSERFHLDTEYSHQIDSWDFQYTFNYLDFQTKNDLVVFPPGADFTALGGGLFDEGVLGSPNVSERHYRLQAISHTVAETHDIRLGLGASQGELYDVREHKNFTISPFGVPVPTGEMVDVTNTAPFITEQDRVIKYGFVQDEWNFIPDWRLTTGIRADDYSDFGTTINPRIALVHEAAYDLSLKLLYGKAFRAPSFAELYAINNPVALGDPSLEPEKIKTLEFGVLYFPFNYQLNFNIYTFNAEDIILFAPDPDIPTSLVAKNVGELNGKGAEVEFIKEFGESFKLRFNSARQEVEDELTHEPAGRAPGWTSYLEGDWKINDGYTVYAYINYIADRKRETGDMREPTADYTLVDFVLRYARSSWTVELQAKNVFDEEAFEPTPISSGITGDLPMAGRSAYIEINYDF